MLSSPISTGPKKFINLQFQFGKDHKQTKSLLRAYFWLLFQWTKERASKEAPILRTCYMSSSIPASERFTSSPTNGRNFGDHISFSIYINQYRLGLLISSFFGYLAMMVVLCAHTENHRLTTLIIVLTSVLVSHRAHRFPIKKLSMGYGNSDDVMFPWLFNLLNLDIVRIFFDQFKPLFTYFLFERLFFLKNTSSRR